MTVDLDRLLQKEEEKDIDTMFERLQEQIDNLGPTVLVEDVHVFESLSHTLADKTNSIIETYTKEGWKVSQMNFYKGTELYGIQGHIPTIGYSIVFERKDD